MKRAQAFALVRTWGGTPRQGVTRQTNVLIIGELGWPLLSDGRASNTLTQAKNYGVPIASERQFLAWVGKAVPDLQTKTYTAAQLASLSRLSQEVVEQLAMFGLIEPTSGLYGFRDLAAARQIAGLLASNVALSVITRNLHNIRKWLPDARLSSLRMFPESSDRILIEQLNGRTDETGQFVLPVNREEEDADELFERAQSFEQAQDVATAEQLYRRVMNLDPGDPAAAFNLGNLLRSDGRMLEAEAAYRSALQADPSFAEAWYNLADLLDSERRSKDAVDCLRRAVAADPTYADAMFNLAFLLQRLGYHADAAVWWRRYLELDAASPWAARAKRALKFCEIQLASSS